MTIPEHVHIFTDGGSRGNPGPAATGIVVCDTNDVPLHSFGTFHGTQTNNYAEYMAVIEALAWASEENNAITHIDFFCDSKLVVEQLNRNWKVKEPTIQTLFMKAWNLMQSFHTVTFTYIPRAQNKPADAKVNEILDSTLA
jgi:ribonuclease HI